jgi:hypothetical protein
MARSFSRLKAPRRVQLCDLTPEQRGNLEALRGLAMRIAIRIEEMLPKSAAVATDGKGANVLPEEFDRLLGRNDGIVDSLERLARVVVRLIDKEREYSESAAATFIDVPRMDEAELDRRIAAELDFIADQRRTVGLP